MNVRVPNYPLLSSRDFDITFSTALPLSVVLMMLTLLYTVESSISGPALIATFATSSSPAILSSATRFTIAQDATAVAIAALAANAAFAGNFAFPTKSAFARKLLLRQM